MDFIFFMYSKGLLEIIFIEQNFVITFYRIVNNYIGININVDIDIKCNG